MSSRKTSTCFAQIWWPMQPIRKHVKLLLKDENNNKLYSKKLQITLNNKVYSVSTDKNGIAKLNINLKNSGSYNLKISFNGDNYYNSACKVVKITVKKTESKINC